MRKRLELKAARVRKGWTQLRLAAIMSVSQQTVAKWEQGRNAPSTLKKIRKLESVLDVPMELLFPDIFGDYIEKGGGPFEAQAARSFDRSRSGRAAQDKPVVGL